MPSVVVVDGNADLRFLISPLLRLDGTLLSRLGRLGLKPTRQIPPSDASRTYA
jgi:hypothetical protein